MVVVVLGLVLILTTRQTSFFCPPPPSVVSSVYVANYTKSVTVVFWMRVDRKNTHISFYSERSLGFFFFFSYESEGGTEEKKSGKGGGQRHMLQLEGIHNTLNTGKMFHMCGSFFFFFLSSLLCGSLWVCNRHQEQPAPLLGTLNIQRMH